MGRGKADARRGCLIFGNLRLARISPVRPLRSLASTTAGGSHSHEQKTPARESFQPSKTSSLSNPSFPLAELAALTQTSPPAAGRNSGKMARDSKNTVVSREYTINLHKRLHGVTFKKRAPRAVKEIKAFAAKVMLTKDVRVDVKLNKAIWSQGIRSVPNKLRVVINRLRDESAEEETMYSLVELAAEQDFAGKGVVVLDS